MNKAVKSFSVNACFSEDDYFSGYILRSAVVMLEYGLLSFVRNHHVFLQSGFLRNYSAIYIPTNDINLSFHNPGIIGDITVFYLNYSHRCTLTSCLHCSLSFSNGYQFQNSSCMLVCMFSLMNEVFIFHLISILVTVFPLEL